MVVVILKIKLELPSVNSLKEKRRILKSMLVRLKNNFNISAAEVDNNDVHRLATLGMAIVTNQTGYGDKVMAKVVDKIRANSDVLIIDYHTEIY